MGVYPEFNDEPASAASPPLRQHLI